MKRLTLLKRIWLRIKMGEWPPSWTKYYSTSPLLKFGVTFFQEKQSENLKVVYFQYGGDEYAALYVWGGNSNYVIYDLQSGLPIDKFTSPFIYQIYSLNFATRK